MAIGVVKLTKPQRKFLTLTFSVLNLIQILLGCGITGSSIYIYIAISPVLYTEKSEINFVFVVTGMYGTHVIFHWLIGMKICSKCYLQAHKKSTRSLLLLWTCAGTNTVINLIIIAGMSRKINKHIVKSMRNSLHSGMINYLNDPTWKYNMDKIQFTQQCCGIKGFEDWHEESWLTKYHIDINSQPVQDFRSDPDNLHLPVIPWSCCKIDFPMQCLHDPLQQVQYAHIWADEPNIVTDSINTKGCLEHLRKPITYIITAFILVSSTIVILHVTIFLLSRILYTSCRNAILLNDEDGIAPGWIFGRGDCGYNRGSTLAELMLIPEPVVSNKPTKAKMLKNRFLKRKKTQKPDATPKTDTSADEEKMAIVPKKK